MPVTSLVMVVSMAGIFAILAVGGVLALIIDAKVDHGH